MAFNTLDSELKTPYIPPELLLYLDDVFKDTLPMNVGLTLEDVKYLQGQRSVIQLLWRLHEEQMEER